MSQTHPKNNGDKPLGPGGVAQSAFDIPVQYTAGSSLAIEIEPDQSMNNPFQIALSKRPLMPSLFQVAARADDLQPGSRGKSPVSGHARMAERMLNPRKLEAVLNAIGKKKKPAGH
jgi:hypothetical protein